MTGGTSTFKGINNQAWAAISLFLQNLRYPDFNYIALEQPNLQDFDLVFNDSHKVICEVKAYSIGYYDVKKILSKLAKSNKVSELDELLIICKSTKDRVKNDSENYRYFGEEILRVLKKKKFSEAEIKLFSRLKFWETDVDISRNLAISFFAPIIGVWLPTKNMEEILDSYVLQKIYFGSEKSKIVTRNSLMSEITTRVKELTEDTGYLTEKKNIYKNVEDALNALKKPQSIAWSKNSITSLTNNPEIYYLVLEKLEGLKNINLRSWNNLWRAALSGPFYHKAFDVFKNNIGMVKNQKYLLELLPDIVKSPYINFFRMDFFRNEVSDIIGLLLKSNVSYSEQLFELVKLLLDDRCERHQYNSDSYSRGDHNAWEVEHICKCLKDIYVDSNDTQLRKAIFKYVVETFDLVSDQGNYWHDTPKDIFEIVKREYSIDIKKTLRDFINLINSQYDKHYGRFGKGLKFVGWEHMGGMISNSGGCFHVSDNHFVTNVLSSLFQELYASDSEKAWAFVQKTIIRLEKNVCRDNPDYINRAFIPVIVLALADQTKKDIALEILKDFMEMRQGIPHKTDLIFQELRNSQIPSELKWEVTVLQLKIPIYKGLPANIFVEQLVTDEASKGNSDALEILFRWSQDAEYNNRSRFLDRNITDSVFSLISNDATRRSGITLLRTFLNSEFFKNTLSMFEIWDVAKAITQVIRIDYSEGLSMLQEIWKDSILTENQQRAVTSVFSHFESSDGKLLPKIYGDLLDKWLVQYPSISTLCERIPQSSCREAFVQFGEKLAMTGYYVEALRIAKLFINDPDPIVENEPDDPNGEHNLHKQVIAGKDTNQITSVRVWVCWLLRHICVLNGRKYIEDALPLIETLVNDPNFYVRSFACNALEQFVMNRHTFIPGNPRERFISIDTAYRIETLAFTTLRNPENLKLHQVMLALVHVFSHIRKLSTEDALEVLSIFINTEDDKILEESKSLFVFFAEFRKEAVKDIRYKDAYGEKEWLRLQKFNDKPFKKLLQKLLLTSSSDVRADFAWQFWQLPKESGAGFATNFAISIRYFKYLIRNYDHEVYSRIYYFIDEHLETKPTECLLLWKACIRKEKAFLSKNVNDQNFVEMHWWPYHHNGKVLEVIYKTEGSDEFLIWLQKIVTYPKGLLLGDDLILAVDILCSFEYSKKVDSLFKNLINLRGSNYYQSW
ncbi:hypothetical protein GYA27_01405, partial [candidate division WWE3 bacterium]|nr:hypothetical protein [candidate division WWE3 bacterium]